MSALGVIAGITQPVLIVAGSPLLVGVLGKVRARLEGRVGAGIWQPYRDLRKLFGKEPVDPGGTSEVFRTAPLLLLATTVVVAVVAPFVAAESAVGAAADLFAVVALLALGAVALVLGGLDTGTGFGGLGAGRRLTILALAEPTLLVAVLALATRAGSTNLGEIVSATLDDPMRVISPGSLLAAAALVVAIVAETGRRPVDDPATGEEATMIHGATELDYAGPDLALVRLASAMRLTVLLGLLANLFVPWGIATSDAGGADAGTVLVGVAALVVKVGVLGVLVAVAEVFVARLRLVRVPELLAGSFVLALLAVSASFFLA
ncbi:respiratory chain complex I subunit 1 family protein [Actinophytocola sp.]|uniref:respiratory chain complex I subunit 1 family protein n=1 Tax=Actinophytocola sp. TaxID=1872138 RepID=UPI003D6A3DCE